VAHYQIMLAQKVRSILSFISRSFVWLLLLTPILADGQQSDGPGPSPEVKKFVSYDASQATVLLLHIRVIDGTGAPAREDQTVTLRAGKIAGVHATSQNEVADGKSALDLSGRTLLPGIVGMHDHLFYVARPEDNAEHQNAFPTLLPQMSYSAPRLYLANGVTTLRTTGSMDPYTDLNLREAIEALKIPGPHLDVTGPYIEGEGNQFLQMHTLHGPEETRRMVDFWPTRECPASKHIQT